MKKFLPLLSLLLCFSFVATAQSVMNYEIEVTDTTLYGEAEQSDFYGNIDLENLTNAALPMTWVRIENDLPGAWESSVCDPNICHPTATDSANFNMPVFSPGNYINVHFYPHGENGMGMLRIKLYERDNPDETISILTFNGDASGTTAITEPDLNFIAFESYPNPFANSTKVIYELETAGNAQLVVADATGKTVFMEELIGRSGDVVVGNQLPAGLYTYSLVQNSQLLESKKMLKSN